MPPPWIGISATVTFSNLQAKETILDSLSLGHVTTQSFLPLHMHPTT